MRVRSVRENEKNNWEMRFLTCPDGGIGRHKGLKIPRPQGCAGSSPAPGTIDITEEKRLSLKIAKGAFLV